jgi:ankyrin repeat protein
MTALHLAAGLGTPDNVAALLEAGASGSAKDKSGKTAFDYAERNIALKGTAAYWALNDAQYK